MRRRRVGIAAAALMAALTSCAAVQPGVLATPAPSEPQPVMIIGGGSLDTGVDEAGQEKAAEWLAAIEMPAGAEFSSEPTGLTPLVGYQQHMSHCEPVAETNGFWLIEDTSLNAVVDWVMANPAEGMKAKGGYNPPSDPGDVTIVSAAHVPVDEEHQGILFTIVNDSETVVAVRAQVVAFGENTVCPDPAPGTEWGGFGEG